LDRSVLFSDLESTLERQEKDNFTGIEEFRSISRIASSKNLGEEARQQAFEKGAATDLRPADQKSGTSEFHNLLMCNLDGLQEVDAVALSTRTDETYTRTPLTPFGLRAAWVICFVVLTRQY